MNILGARLESLFDFEVAAAQAEPKLVPDLLYPEELELIARFAPVRQAEFATARVCARRALGKLGVAPTPLLPNDDRSPRWPSGIVGSITHCRSCCAVVVARASNTRGLGIDAEENAPLERDLEARVCTTGERRWLEPFRDDERGLLGKVIFSAKEALYKCQYPLTHTYLDFHDVELRVDLGTATFSAVAPPPLVARARGRFVRTPGFIVTAASIV
jgi:4'-phosphopantetheinyl transferase EntD